MGGLEGPPQAPQRSAGVVGPPLECPSRNSERDAERFLERRLAEEGFGEAVLKHGLHAAGDRFGANGRRVASLHYHRADPAVDLEQLERADTSAEATAVALGASPAAEQPDARQRVVRRAEHALAAQHLDRPIEVVAALQRIQDRA